MDKSEIRTLILAVLRDVADLQGMALPGDPLPDDFRLMGAPSPLDSMAFVMLTSGIEQRLYEERQVSVTIVDEKAMSLRNSPFRTLGSLTDYVHRLVESA